MRTHFDEWQLILIAIQNLVYLDVHHPGILEMVECCICGVPLHFVRLISRKEEEPRAFTLFFFTFFGSKAVRAVKASACNQWRCISQQEPAWQALLP